MGPPEQATSFEAGDPFLDGLNPPQREAVVHDRGPLLVLAGAGSGKTRVITHRIAWLIRHRGVDPRGIVAVTFTNKAAGEMRDRVHRILGAPPEGAWIGTFHGLCLRLLRRDGERVGLAAGFNIYDSDDQMALVRRALREEGADDTSTARPLLSRISRAKNALEPPSAAEKRAFSPDAKLFARVYARYEEGLRRSNAVDFDDLLLKALELVDAEKNPDVRERYARRCEHLLVDEYQDTNRPQYLLVRALSSVHGNVIVVGDEDQSIYKFRGAEIRNILDFERDHRGAKTVKLEENYRSTGVILEAAGAVIANNTERKGKTLWTKNGRGEPIDLMRAADDRSEAAWIAGRVRSLARDRAFEDVAVLYRTNAQSRQLEEIFRRERLPYQVVGAVQFYERKEIKDVLAYLKLLANPSDDVSFRRVVNTPPRGIGDTTLRAVEDVARARAVPLRAAARAVLDENLLPSRAARMLRDFLELLDGLAARAADEPVAVILQSLVEAIRYEAYLEKSYPGESFDRVDNVESLVSAAVEFERETDDPTLLGFLDRSALVSDADEVGERPGVTLMTIHCAKGLEFPVVFLAGLEENLFPHARSAGSPEDLEEERRLCYVAMTRAKERLLLSLAASRLIQGVPQYNAPSRFLDEVPPHLVREEGPARSDAWNDVRESGSSAARAATRVAASSATPRPAAPSRPSGPPPADGFAVGSTVRHPMFGDGRVTEREGAGPALKLTIQFVGYGKKRILPSYTRLEVLN